MFPITLLSVLVLGILSLGAMGAVVSTDAEAALNLINEHRTQQGLVPLIFNGALNNAAQKWAHHMLTSNTLVHADENIRNGQGEVIAHFSTSTVDDSVSGPLAYAARHWLAGGVSYPPGAVVNSGSESWIHWSQLLWHSTTEIGCGVASSNIDNVFQSFVACRLTPEGNIVGESPLPSQEMSLVAARQNTSPGPFTGDLTFFTPGLGACGNNDAGAGGILALSHIKMGAPSNNNPLCDRLVRLEANGKATTATVRDKCMGCAEGDVDVSEDVFLFLYGSLDIGRAPVTWELLN